MVQSLVVVSVVAVAVAEHPIRQSIVDRVNARGAWQAAPIESNRFANYSVSEIKALLGLQQVEDPGAGFRSGIEVGDIPASFDGRVEFSSCQKAVRDQAGCGSCWAFGAAETLTTNLCALGLSTPVLSPQDLVSCDTANNGCSGGTLPGAWNFIDSKGLRSDTCVPYTSGEGDVESCPVACSGYGDSTRYGCPTTPTWMNSDKEIQAVVMTVGAVEVGFTVYEDFMNYAGGVYSYQEGQMLGGHAVKIVGWGQHFEQFYWVVQNSWGPSFGESGFFKIANWHEDKNSAIAIAGGHACVQGATPAPPTPGPSPSACEDIVSYCGDYDRSKCEATSYIIPVCKQTCGCCDAYKPSYCPADSLMV